MVADALPSAGEGDCGVTCGELGRVAPWEEEEEEESLGKLGKAGALCLLRETSPPPSWCLFFLCFHESLPPGL